MVQLLTLVVLSLQVLEKGSAAGADELSRESNLELDGQLS